MSLALHITGKNETDDFQRKVKFRKPTSYTMSEAFSLIACISDETGGNIDGADFFKRILSPLWRIQT